MTSGSARLRCVLAILLLTPRTIVPAETLIDRLWDTQPPPKARESLSVYIARLRASLRQAVGDERAAGRARQGLRARGRSRGQSTCTSSAGCAGRRTRWPPAATTTSAAELLREADGLWRGQALAGIGGDWVARMRDSLEEERRAAILERVECELELGRHADLVGELHHLLAQYPLDETFIAPPDDRPVPERQAGRRPEPVPGDPAAAWSRSRAPSPGRRCPSCTSASWAGTPALAVHAAVQRPPGARRHAAPTPCRPRRRSSWAATQELGSADRGARRRPAGRRHRGHAGRGQDRAGGARRPRGSPGSTRTGRSTSTCTPTIPGSPSLDAGRGAAPPAADAGRAGHADTRDRSASAPRCGGPSSAAAAPS